MKQPNLLQPNLLQHYQSTHAGFLHALGESGTEYLLRQMDLCGTERVLEIGFGTGATLVKLKSRYPKLQLSGLEANPEMISKCRGRLAFCGLKNKISLLSVNEKNKIPANAFDVVYLESVLGILDEKTMLDTLVFIQKILRPNGRLVFNESIWLKSTTPQEIAEINQHGAQVFGIIQCNPVFSGIEKTIEYLEKFGFKAAFSQQMTREEAPVVDRKNYRERLSKLYSGIGKLRLLLNGKLRQNDKKFKAEMKNVFKSDKAYLSGFILVLKKI